METGAESMDGGGEQRLNCAQRYRGRGGGGGVGEKKGKPHNEQTAEAQRDVFQSERFYA